MKISSLLAEHTVAEVAAGRMRIVVMARNHLVVVSHTMVVGRRTMMDRCMVVDQVGMTEVVQIGTKLVQVHNLTQEANCRMVAADHNLVQDRTLMVAHNLEAHISRAAHTSKARIYLVHKKMVSEHTLVAARKVVVCNLADTHLVSVRTLSLDYTLVCILASMDTSMLELVHTNLALVCKNHS